jgi:hypothetical protein
VFLSLERGFGSNLKLTRRCGFQVDDGDGGELRDIYKGSEVNFQLDSLSPGRSYR